MKLLLVVALAALLAGCSPAPKPHKFQDGQFVKCKVGGPVGIVVESRLYANGEGVTVRFYKKPQGVQIGIGGNGLISGGTGITGGEYYIENFESYELEAVKTVGILQ